MNWTLVQEFSINLIRFLFTLILKQDSNQETTGNARKKLPLVARQDKVGTSTIISGRPQKLNQFNKLLQQEKKTERKDQTKTPAQLSKNPYSKEDSRKYFRIKDQNETFYSMKQADIKIQQQLLKMSQHGFDIKTINWKFENNKRQIYQKYQKKPFKGFNRKIYALFKCPKCINNYGQEKQWKSILGNFEIKFDVAGLQQFWQQYPEYREKGVNLNKMKYPSIVKRQMKMYKEKCRKCDRWVSHTFSNHN